MNNNFSVIILAAGLGKRMKSKVPKVLHIIAGKPMLTRTLEVLKQVGPSQIIIVVSPSNLRQLRNQIDSKVEFAIQKEPLGTADATKVGLAKIDTRVASVAVMYGDDTSFYKPETINKVFHYHQQLNPKITFVTVEIENPQGLGRIIRKKDKVIAIVEEKNATPSQRKIKEVNDGLYFFDKNWLAQHLSEIKSSPITGEFYLTDLIKIAFQNGQKVTAYKLPDSSEWYGINTLEELAQANLLKGSEPLRRRIHIMGAAGAGAAVIYQIAKSYGYQVTGCDLQPESAYTKNLNLKIQNGHSAKHLAGVDTLIISPAVTKFNPQNEELQYAKNVGMPVLTWQEFQGKFLQKDKFVITIAGAYGKSTTTSMVSQILIDSGLDPTCEIGARVLGWKGNFRVGLSKFYVCEADEYNNNFLNYHPDIAVILNIAWDHPDFFKKEEDVISSYKKFVRQIKSNGILVLADFSKSDELANLRSDIKVIKIKDFGPYNLSIIGDFRAQNANAALTIAEILKIDLKKAKKSVEDFKGIGRRLEYKGQIHGVKIFDDYAVQPYTVKTTADALKDKFRNQRVALVFEPHTFSRIKTFFEDFVKSLSSTKIDRVIITDVYAAREKGDSQDLAKKLAKAIGSKAIYTGSIKETANHIKKNLDKFDVICSMGAGDSYKLADLIKT